MSNSLGSKAKYSTPTRNTDIVPANSEFKADSVGGSKQYPSK